MHTVTRRTAAHKAGELMPNQKYEAFVTVAKTGSFKRTAEILGYTQAGVSYMMSSLEQEMGTALFTRDHSGARLTADGRNLLPWIQDVCASEQALQTRLEELRSVEYGSLRVASFGSIAVQWLPGIMEMFLNDHPNIDYELVTYESQNEMEEATWRGEFDCCFVILPAKLDFFTIPLAQDPVYVVLPPSHPLAHAPFFPKESLATEPYIKVRSSDDHTEFDAVFARHEVAPRTRFVMDNDHAVMGMVNKGFGFSMFPQLVLESAPFELARVELEIPTHRELALAVRSHGLASMETKAFIEYVRRWVAKNNE